MREDVWQDENVLSPVPPSDTSSKWRGTRRRSRAGEGESVGWSGFIGWRRGTNGGIEGQGVWSAGMMGRLADAVSYDAVLALLDHCASKPGQWIPKAEVEEVDGVSPIQLRNELGSSSKKTKKLFGEAIWPMEWKKERGAYHYRLNPLVAQWWADARAKSEGPR